MRALLVATLMALAGLAPAADSLRLTGHERVAVLRIWGPIFDPADALAWIRRIDRGQLKVRALVVDVDSPGGGVAPSQEIHDALLKLRAKGVKVVVSMGSEAASGGYYIACAADRIYAQPGTLTGSIGVIMEMVSAQKLLDWAGVRFETIKSGPYKDTGSFSRTMTKDDRRVLQNVVDDVYDQFVEAVVEGRKASLAAAWTEYYGGGRAKPTDAQIEAYARTLADGRVYTGRQACDYGLVDELGGFDDAVEGACELAGIAGQPVLVAPRKKVPFLERLTGMNFSSINAWFVHLNPRGSTRLCFLAR